VALVIGAAVRVSPALFSPNNTLAAIIAQNFGEAQGIQRSALIGLGVVLFVITLLVNVMARAVLNRGERRLAAGR
jgi:phosphate transport system permease protein